MFIDDLGITTDDQLKKICNDLHIELNWIGFEDYLVDQECKNGGYIINIGNESGTHWQSLYVFDKQIFFFDSFAVPMNDTVIKFCKKNKIKNLMWNDHEMFQKIDESLCGIWCVIFLYYMQNEKGTLNKRFDKFCEDL